MAPKASFLTSDAPGRIDEFRRWAEPMLGEQYRGAMLEQFATMTTQNRDADRQATDQFASLGLNPAAFVGRIQPEMQQRRAEQAGGIRGAAIAGEADASIQLRGNMLSALNQIEAYYDSLQLQNFIAYNARKTAQSSGGGGGYSFW